MRFAGRYRRGARIVPSIPTASMADIAFLLLIFFLTSTIFRLERGLDVELPRSLAPEQRPQQPVARIWVDPAGRVAIDDVEVSIEEVAPVVRAKLARSSDLVFRLHIDRSTPYRLVDPLLAALKRGNARNIIIATEPAPGKP